MTPKSKLNTAALIFAFLTVCFILVSIVVLGEFWKYYQFKTYMASLPDTPPSHTMEGALFYESFSDNALTDWKEEIRNGSTHYSIQQEAPGNYYLHAESQKSASLLIKKVKFDPREYPYLKWRWRVEKLGGPADMKTKQGSDAPARMYVAFYNGFGIWNIRLLNYVWASSMEKGSQVQSPYSSNSRIVVVESGSENVGKWTEESRNILEDYRKLFGEEPQQVEAISILTDSDNTNSEAIASYDDIEISKAPSLSNDPKT